MQYKLGEVVWFVVGVTAKDGPACCSSLCIFSIEELSGHLSAARTHRIIEAINQAITSLIVL